MSEWIKVDGYKDLPEGQWLVKVDEPHFDLYYHTAMVHPNITMIGGLFGFDAHRVIAYRSIPEYTEQ